MGYVRFIARNAGKFVTLRDKEGKAKKDSKVPGDFENRKDRVALLDIKGKLTETKRIESDFCECPADTLYATTIANVLYVLCGLRPIPTIRLKNHFTLDLLKRNDFLTDISKQSYVQTLTATKRIILNKDASVWEQSIAEIKICHPWYMSPENAKNVDLSNITSEVYQVLTWDRTLARLADNAANFGVALSKLTNIPRAELMKSPLPDILKTVHSKYIDASKEKQQEFIAAFDTIRCQWLLDLLTVGKATVDLRYTKGFELMNTKRPAKVVVTDYEIYVPYSELLEQMLDKGCGFASILEGGMVKYDGYVDELPEGVQPTYTEAEGKQ